MFGEVEADDTPIVDVSKRWVQRHLDRVTDVAVAVHFRHALQTRLKWSYLRSVVAIVACRSRLRTS